MKKLIFLTILAGIAFGCVKDLTYRNEQNKAIILAHYDFTEDFEVPILEGQTTRVEVDGIVVYEGNLPMTIDVPRRATISRGASEVKCFFTPSETDIVAGSVHRRGMLLFEDLNNGDNDYNDFVCEIFEHLNIQMVGNKYRVALNGTHFTPLALGNSYTIPLKFGYEFRDSKTGALIEEVILTDNIRNDWFGGLLGFMNTVIGGETYPAKQVNVKDSEFSENLDNPIAFNWFIVVDGKKRYTTDAHKYLEAGVSYNEVVMYRQTPFGLFLISKDKDSYRWPVEKCPIWSAYPDFVAWLRGLNDDPFATKVEDNLYK